MIRHLFIILLCLLSVKGLTQGKYRFNNYTINNGLSQSSVITIIQDNHNALWAGTQDGINRYDGKKFEIFNSDNTPGIESEYVICSLKDLNGDLWFGTNKGLVYYNFNKEKFKTFLISPLSPGQINSIVEGEDNTLWLTTEESGLFLFDKNKGRFIKKAKTLNRAKTKHLGLSRSGNLIIATEKEGAYIFNYKKSTLEQVIFPKSFGKNTLFNRIIIQEDRVMFATTIGVYELNLTTKKTTKIFNAFDEKVGAQNVSDVYFEKGQGWFICTNNNGLFVINEKGDLEHCTEDVFQKRALLFNNLNKIFKDNSGVFWIGSQRGLSSFNPANSGFLGIGVSGIESKGIPNPSVWSFADLPDDNQVFIGTDEAVTRLNTKTGVFRQFKREKSTISKESGQTATLALYAINNERILVGCADGLYLLEIHEKKHNYKRVFPLSGKKHQRIYRIIHWKEQLYWLATKDGAILYNYSTKTATPFEHDVNNKEATISQGVCRVVYKDYNNRVWFTTSAGGLCYLSQKDGKVEIIPYEFNYKIKKASTKYITSIFQKNEQEYWLGTFGGGLIKWNEKEKSTALVNKQNGLPNNVIYGILEGENNSLWLSTNKGLSNYNHKSKKVKNYTEVDGLMSNEFNLGAVMKSESGVIYFGGIYGYNYFNPKELSQTEYDIHVGFTKFKLEKDWLVGGEKNSPLTKPIYLTKEILLGVGQRSFTIKFQPSDISNSELLNYKYILEGSEEGEVFIGTTNNIHFISLSHGSYKLKVYARIGEGSWSTIPAEIRIEIDSPLWFKWSFWLIAVVVLAILIRWYFSKRIKNARREQLRLEIKISERTREIKQQSKEIDQQRKKIEAEKNKVVEEQKKLQTEKDKTERLLKNIMPTSTADELKKSGKARARSYKKVSVLFTDFVGFTKISDEMSATELVKKLDVYFTNFDKIIVKNNLEKIKTIGDAYMCAGGVPVRNITNPIDAVTAALQIQAYMQKRKNDAIANGREYWTLRLGINTGEVTAGVIGSERLAYDIWGATVNRAQRMEMLGQPGSVTITGATYTLIEPYFECRYAGKAETKSKEMIEVYVVERIKTELSKKGEGIEPNEKFHQIVNLHHYSTINYYKAERHIMSVLGRQLSPNLHYHSIAHTKDVVSAVERLALAENVTDEGLFLLKSAATYHDAGFVEKYEKNEPIGARMAEEILPLYGYSESHIEKIKELIFVTKIPHAPKNNLEEIICDADLDYLGRSDFHEIAARLCKELIEHGKIENEKAWDEIQIKFLTHHRYFTKTARKTRKNKKEANLLEVITRLEENNYKP